MHSVAKDCINEEGAFQMELQIAKKLEDSEEFMAGRFAMQQLAVYKSLTARRELLQGYITEFVL